MNEAPVYPLSTQIDSVKSGILRLRDDIAKYFALYNVPATVPPVGLKYRSFALNQSAPGNANRVCIIPGEFDGSAVPKPRRYGTLSRSNRNHASVNNPRELASWDRPITISCWSAPPPGQAKDEGAIIALAEDLLQEVVRAVHASGCSDITWGAVTINAPVENPFGVELLVSITQRGPLYDTTLDYAQPTSGLTSEDVEIS